MQLRKFRSFFMLIALVSFLIHSVIPTNAAIAETVGIKKDIYGRSYVAISGDGIGKNPEEGYSLYDGVQFPLYCGYVTSYPDGKIIFTKKTDLPITKIVAFFNRAEKEGKVTVGRYGPYRSAIYFGKYGITEEMTRDSSFFQSIVEDEMLMTYRLHTLKGGLYTEPVDEKFSPKFRETCTFNSKANPPEYCKEIRPNDVYIKEPQ